MSGRGAWTRALVPGGLLAVLLIAACSDPQPRTSPDPAPSPPPGGRAARCLLLTGRDAPQGTLVTLVVPEGLELARPYEEVDACLVRRIGEQQEVAAISLEDTSLAELKREEVDPWLDSTGDEQVASVDYDEEVEMFGGLRGERLVYEAAGDGVPFRRVVLQSGQVRLHCTSDPAERCEEDLADLLASVRVTVGVERSVPGSGTPTRPPDTRAVSCPLGDASGELTATTVTAYLPRAWPPLRGVAVTTDDPEERDRCESRTTGPGRPAVLAVTLTGQSLDDYENSVYPEDLIGGFDAVDDVRFTDRLLAGRTALRFSFTAGPPDARFAQYVVQAGGVRVSCTAPQDSRACRSLLRVTLPTVRLR